MLCSLRIGIRFVVNTWDMSRGRFVYLFTINNRQARGKSVPCEGCCADCVLAYLSSTHVELEKRRLRLRTDEEGDVLAHHWDGEHRSIPAMTRGSVHSANQLISRSLSHGAHGCIHRATTRGRVTAATGAVYASCNSTRQSNRSSRRLSYCACIV